MQAEWVFFDGECGFCHRWVQWVVKRDRDGRAFRFAPRKGETFQLLVAWERRQALPPSILVLTTQGRILTRSSAVLHILERLGGVWRGDGCRWADCAGRDQGCGVPIHRPCAAWAYAGAGLGMPCGSA